MNNATAQVVEQQMTPMAGAVIERQVVMTGQYLYDNFVTSSDEQITRMSMVRQAIDVLDVSTMTKVCNDMVEIARKHDALTVVQRTGATTELKGKKGPKVAQAMNARTILQQAYGALRFARVALDTLGYSDRTGYQEMRVIAKSALVAAKINWKGEAVLTEEQKETKAKAKAQKEEKDVLEEVMKSTVRGENESLMNFNIRVAQIADVRLNALKEQAQLEKMQVLVDSIIEQYSDVQIEDIGFALLKAVGLDLKTEEVSEEEEEAIAE